MLKETEELFNSAMLLHKSVHGDKNFNQLIDQACEECAELIVALQHYRRKRVSAAEVLEEYVDIGINLEPILKEMGFTPEDSEKVLHRKVQKFYDKVRRLYEGSTYV